MNRSDTGTASFGPFRLSPATRELERDGVRLALGDRALDILIVLIERAGEVVSHRDLHARVWRDLVVAPGSLRAHMAILRKALGDGENGARYIENVTGQGYCFVAPINSAAAPQFPDVAQAIGADLVTERFISFIGAEGTGGTTDSGLPPADGDPSSFISTDVEYALHCLLLLVDPAGRPVAMSLRDMADLQGISREHLEKIFRQLLQAEIVVEAEGAGRGFALARAASKISFHDVILAVDGRQPLFTCKNVRLRCALFGGKAPRWATKGLCSIHAVMMEAESSMRAVLVSRTLADLASRVAAKAPATFVDDISNWLAQRAADNANEV
jgi:Rrf2 family protein